LATTTTPGDGKPVRNARNVADGFVLLSQAAAGLRPTWDGTAFDVPCVRSDGTQYLTRSTSLSAPGLIIAAVALDGAATDSRAISGSRSTETPGGAEPREDAWSLDRSNVGTMRGLVATSSGQSFTDTPQILGEKIVVMMEVVDSTLQVWQCGEIGQQRAIVHMPPRCGG
jgi:hypothetical protein